MVILRPFGPVAFVYDIADTEGEPFPPQLIDPFYAEGTVTKSEIDYFASSMRNCGIVYKEMELNENLAGYTSIIDSSVKIKYNDKDTLLLQPFGMTVNMNKNPSTKLATIYHELGHLYCGHLEWAGLSKTKWKNIPQRYTLPLNSMEFEAESVCWLLCERQGINNPSAAYLRGYLDANEATPDISVETVLKAVAQIEIIYKGVKAPRKELIVKK